MRTAVSVTKAPRSIVAFALFLLLGASGLVVAPQAVVLIVGLPDAGVLWPRLLALPMAVISSFYLQAAKDRTTAFFRWTLPARLVGAVFMITLAATRIGPPFLVILATIDLAAALWTWLELRGSRGA